MSEACSATLELIRPEVMTYEFYACEASAGHDGIHRRGAWWWFERHAVQVRVADFIAAQRREVLAP